MSCRAASFAAATRAPSKRRAGTGAEWLAFDPADSEPAAVTWAVTSADGFSSANLSIIVPAHAVAQVNDIFAAPPFDVIRTHNGTATAAASVVSSTRLYAIGWGVHKQKKTDKHS